MPLDNETPVALTKASQLSSAHSQEETQAWSQRKVKFLLANQAIQKILAMNAGGQNFQTIAECLEFTWKIIMREFNEVHRQKKTIKMNSLLSKKPSQHAEKYSVRLALMQNNPNIKLT
ncbi:hypothetical protein DSO57_1030068 [Entomophthora muscae]|uniref:Uncharacterized protein n=1 Tax=Entomophthora muscae TaxID=34485 RepID=A0ACC2S2W7_9FUNG|nr:hypothetical protein DSO57_1030068 [Entomophthora muscae]